MAKRGKKLPKRYQSDFINVYGGLDQNKIRAYQIFNNRSRVLSTKGKRGDNEPVLNNTFTREVPATVSKPMYYGVHPKVNKPMEYMDKDRKGEIVKHVEVLRSEEAEAREEHSPFKVWLPTPKRKAEVRAREMAQTRTLYEVWQSERRQGVKQFHELVIEKKPGFCAKFIFSGQEWMIVQESTERRFISKIYKTRQEAYKAWGTRTVVWLKEEKIG